MPLGSPSQTCSPSAASTPSSTPASIIPIAPPSPSSAGWNMYFTVPRHWSRERASRSATARPMATCASCPQACITPAVPETKSWPHSSVMGSASMSARSSSVGPSPAPPRSVPTTPVTASPVCTS